MISHVAVRSGVPGALVAGGGEARWLADVAAGTVTAAGGQADDDGDGQLDDVAWSILGSPEAWQAVVGWQLNLHTALRRCDLRYCSPGEASPLVTQTRVALLADLLGLGSWPQADPPTPDTAAAADAAPGLARRTAYRSEEYQRALCGNR